MDESSFPQPRSVVPLLPVTIPMGNIRYAPGVRAGRWIFATGHKGAENYAEGISPAVLSAGMPHWDGPKQRREADLIFRNLANVFTAGEADLANVVRVDQQYVSPRAIEPYHDARRSAMPGHIPPSTSTLTPRFLLRNQEIEVHMIGIRPREDFCVRRVEVDQGIHPSSGYSPGVTVGDYVFIAGRIADSFKFGEGIAQEARLPDGYLWKATPVKLETEYIVRRKIEPILEASGSSLESIVKCQVYLRDPDDFGRFNEIWRTIFPENPPATTLIPTSTPAFTVADARVEINAIALRNGGSTRKEVIDAGVETPFANYTQAIRAGDLLLISGMLAVDRGGLVHEARGEPSQPYFGSSVQAQMSAILHNARRICERAGTSLENVVRIQQFHTDLNDFYPAYQVWAAHLPGQYLPISAVEVPFLPVPGCTVQLDLWVYAPEPPKDSSNMEN